MRNQKHRKVIFGLLFVMTLTFASCSSFCVENMMELGLKRMSGPGAGNWSAGPGDDQSKKDEVVIKRAFEAIKAGDYQEFNGLTITTADIMMNRMKLSPMSEGQSYAGSVLKPEEKKRLKSEFSQAGDGGEGQIDFKTAQWKGLILVATGNQALPETGSVFFSSYALLIEQDGKMVDTSELSPRFVMVDWSGTRRILALDFSPPEPKKGPGNQPGPGGYPSPEREEYSPPSHFREEAPPPPYPPPNEDERPSYRRRREAEPPPYPPPNEPEPYNPPPYEPPPEPYPPPNDSGN